MSIETELLSRSNSKCELCTSEIDLVAYEVQPNTLNSVESFVQLCEACLTQIEDPDKVDVNHWRCLNESMWTEVPAVQVMIWRTLNRLKSEGWPMDLLDMLYLDEETLKWAQATGEGKSDEKVAKHIDSNGAQLLHGDSVTLIKNLNVKGTSFIAKRGTAVRNISLVADDHEHIEGRVNDQHIVMLTKFVKKSG